MRIEPRITRTTRLARFDVIKARSSMRNLPWSNLSRFLRRHRRLLAFFNQDLDIIPGDADGITAGLDLGTVGPGSIGQPKAPPVPGTGDDSIADLTLAQRPAHMQTNIVEGEE